MANPATAPPPIYHHSPLYPSSLPKLLEPVLPAGLPLCRRLQFPHRNGFEFVLATFPTTTTALPATFAIAYCDRSRRPESQCFIFSSLELSRTWHPDTNPPANPSNSSSKRGSTSANESEQAAEPRPADFDLAIAQLRALLTTVYEIPYPPSQDEDGYASRCVANLDARARAAAAAEWDEAADPVLVELRTSRAPVEEVSEQDKRERAFILLAAIHGSVSKAIQKQLGLLPKDEWGRDGVWAVWYREWLFDRDEVARRIQGVRADAAAATTTTTTTTAATAPPSTSAPEDLGSAGLPSGLYWSAMLPRDLSAVRNRTHMRRRERTLRLLPSICVRRHPGFVRQPRSSITSASSDAVGTKRGQVVVGADDPIAWAFLGVDGSLSSLHVEVEFRGLGLAKAVAGKLFVEGMEAGYGTERSDRWVHSDVAENNEASVGVMRALGGRKGSEVSWMMVDLRRL